MKLWWFLSFVSTLGALAEASAVPPSSRPLSRRWGAKQHYFPEPKYFEESRYSIHYDARYAVRPLSEDDQRDAIIVLIQTYLSTFRELGVQTWLMHGTLLGWWWGKKVMPWDLDADVQIMEADMYFLAGYHNMTTYYFKYDSIPNGRTFLLEINPYFTHREQDDELNLIDARWIDTQNGLYIDITAARYAVNHEAGEGILFDKNSHEYRDTYLFPLLDTTFEGVPAKIPFKYKDMLASEYGERALTNTKYHDHIFDDEKMRWIKSEDTSDFDGA
ncbi:mannosylphosphorylation protein [Paramyrothecium foliicola]|nr:mannosylphosphorylation protein [Paramyrothecium foliicola]